MSTIEKSVQVNVPVRDAYNQWTKFEEFHRFMEGAPKLQRLNGRRSHGKSEIGEQEKEFEMEIVEQTSDLCIVWTSQSGAISGGVVTFQPLSNGRSKIRVFVAYEPEGVDEDLGNLSVSMQRILERFKEFIESHVQTTVGSLV